VRQPRRRSAGSPDRDAHHARSGERTCPPGHVRDPAPYLDAAAPRRGVLPPRARDRW
jgi:hypothetical protein